MNQPASQPVPHMGSGAVPITGGLLRLALAICCGLALISLFGGPPLGEHESIVALIARQTLTDGHWLIPWCMDTPFLIKPPLTPWLIAIVAKVLPDHAATGLPVSETAARLPSLLAAMLTCWMVYRLARSMLGRACARIAAFTFATSLAAWLFAVNATAESGLMFFCTWAFAEFWFATRAPTVGARRRHMLLFYVAFGLAMLTKGPMPLTMVAMPIAIYWWCDRPLRVFAAHTARRCVPRATAPRTATNAWRHTALAMLGGLWPRLRLAFSRLGLWWGVPIFLAMFVPWMLYVASHNSAYNTWHLWDFEYMQRLKGSYPGDDRGGWWYYLPIFFGQALPWAFSLPEALAAPFMAIYARRRRALTYCWFWIVIGVLCLSAMKFKKPYYALPVLPACAIMLSVVLERFFLGAMPANNRRAKWAVAGILLAILAGMAAGGVVSVRKYPDAWNSALSRWAIPACAMLTLAGIATAGVLYIKRRGLSSMAAVGLTFACVFTVGWCVFGPTLAHLEEPLAVTSELDQHDVPRDAPFYWISNRPDTRIPYYANRPMLHVVDTYKVQADHHAKWDDDNAKLLVAAEAADLLRKQPRVFMLFQRGQLAQFKDYFASAPCHEWFFVDRGKAGQDRSDWVIVSNHTLPATSTGP